MCSTCERNILGCTTAEQYYGNHCECALLVSETNCLGWTTSPKLLQQGVAAVQTMESVKRKVRQDAIKTNGLHCRKQERTSQCVTEDES